MINGNLVVIITSTIKSLRADGLTTLADKIEGDLNRVIARQTTEKVAKFLELAALSASIAYPVSAMIGRPYLLSWAIVAMFTVYARAAVR